MCELCHLGYQKNMGALFRLQDTDRLLCWRISLNHPLWKVAARLSHRRQGRPPLSPDLRRMHSPVPSSSLIVFLLTRGGVVQDQPCPPPVGRELPLTFNSVWVQAAHRRVVESTAAGHTGAMAVLLLSLHVPPHPLLATPPCHRLSPTRPVPPHGPSSSFVFSAQHLRSPPLLTLHPSLLAPPRPTWPQIATATTPPRCLPL
mmetsp:Transcript_4784/g.8201  ORF Transcript_4784/g.8201 Transcript_4784/m.8201 type:complete len:202 (-) Transcript_4784:6-611(-)